MVAWQLGVRLAKDIYLITEGFPAHERYGLSNQLRRASVSVPSNIAEGYGRGARQDYLRFLRMARGSVFEIDTQLLIARELGYLDQDRHTTIEATSHECGRVLAGLIRSIEAGTNA
ncbi:MAG: four helix bundle protein [Phycisphaeraceae bacterium]|nr:four helix bundle protein [Phycisphaeraceae bacterium]